VDSARAQTWVLGAWLAMIGLVTAKQVSTRKGLPQPGAYLGSGVLFTILYGFASIAPQLAVALAVGTDVGGLVAPYLRGSNVSTLDRLSGWLSTISGAQTAQAAPAALSSPGTVTGNVSGTGAPPGVVNYP
jgi:hypothetical protein